jgi:hypothetical protein
MRLYFGGAELPIWRKLLAQEGVTDVSLSFVGILRRVVNLDDWLLADKFPGTQNIFLDSGAFTVNKDTDKYPYGDVLGMSRKYQEYISLNIGRADLVSEFDALVLGQEYINQQREAFYNALGDKFAPVWHSSTGMEEFERLCASYSHVIVPETSLRGFDASSVLSNLIGRYGVKLHGALTRMDLMQTIRWDSVGSTSWLSPSQYGDTAIWVGNELKRYPVKYREQARQRHRILFEQNGFDADKILSDDREEVLRLSLWSWQKFMEHINSRVTTRAETPGPGNTEPPPEPVDNILSVNQNGDMVITRKTVPIPIMGKPRSDENGEAEFISRSESMRRCNTCVLKSTCPGFQADSNCLYNMPVTVRTPADVRALQDGLVEMQAQRVLFMQMSEQLGGGYVDSNLSGEIDRLQRLIKAKHDSEREGFSIKMEASAPANSGMISRIFGNDTAEAISQAEHPVSIPADSIIAEKIYDADVIE